MCINTTVTQKQGWSGRFGAQHDKLIQLQFLMVYFSQPLRLLMLSTPWLEGSQLASEVTKR